jgi:hypothetical protein
LADLRISAQLTEQVASRDTITALLKDGVTAEESTQTGAEELQIT